MVQRNMERGVHTRIEGSLTFADGLPDSIRRVLTYVGLIIEEAILTITATHAPSSGACG